MGLRRQLIIATFVFCAVVGAGVAGLLLSVRSLRAESQSAGHSEEVIATANHLERLTLDLETGQRGYVITHQERFLEPWRGALVAVPAEAARLRALLADNPAQQARAGGIDDAIESYVDDYSRPLVATTRRSPAQGRSVVATGEGKRRVDAIRRRFARLVAAETVLLNSRRARAAHASRVATTAAAAGALLLVALIVLFVAYVSRLVVVPVRRLAHAAGAISEGDYGARVEGVGLGEINELARAFNEMAGSLEQARDELESQNAELELQTAELEDQQLQLTEANDELVAQQSELERTVGELEGERQLIRTFYEFGAQVAGETDRSALATAVVTEVARVAGADVGTLHVVCEDAEGVHELVATRGVDAAHVAAAVQAGIGPAGRAIADAHPVRAASAGGGLVVPTLTGDAPVRHELYLPLVNGEHVVGVITLGRVEDRAFADDEVAALDHLAGQAAVAWANALSFAREQRLQRINSAVLDATRDAIALFRPDGTMILQNEAFRAAAVERGLDEGSSVTAGVLRVAELVEDPDAYRRWYADVLSSETAEGVFEYRLRDSGRSVALYTAPVVDDRGSLLGRLLVLHDTTAEREGERLKTELVATVSHELRTPLASILGFAELLVARDPEPATRRQYLETIYREGRRLTDLVNHFLDLQRIESGSFALRLEPVDMDVVLRETVEVFEAQSAGHVLELAVDESAELAAVADRERIAQVVSNLLSNAIKYSPDGGRVEVAAARNNGSVRVAVSDNGLGIPAKQQQHVFKKFFRGDSSDTRAIGGTGLGLALCEQIVAAHGGSIGFESAEGHGSTFWFELPAADGDA